jgi:stage V sporulation protein B
LAITAAKIYFIVTGLVQQVALKAVLGLDAYGALSSALGAASITYNPVVSASIQGVSHAVATASDADRSRTLRRALLAHLVLALALAGTFFLLAPTIGQLTGAPHIVVGLKVLSAVILVYGLYAPLVGALNGQTRFGTQAALDALAATLRTVGLLGGAVWIGRVGFSNVGPMEGATLGFAVSSAAVLSVAFTRVGLGSAGAPTTRLGRYLRYIGPILLGQALLNLLFQADQLLLRRFAADAALAAGLDAAAADPLVGAYRAAQLFCFLPYQLVLSVGIVLFPVVAAAHREGKADTVAQLVQQGCRVALIVSGLVVSVTCGLPGPLLELVFGADTARLGAEAMVVLSLGLGTLALLGVMTALLNSLEQQRGGLLITGLAFALVVALCFARVRGRAFSPELLTSTAFATGLALLLATLVAGAVVRRKAGAVLPPLSLARVLGALGAAVALARSLPDAPKLVTPLFSLLVAGAYCAALLITRELGPADWHYVRGVLGRKTR